MNTTLVYQVRCKYSGVKIATIEILVTAGALPYFTQWNDTVAYHPLFALPFPRLTQVVKDEWNRLARLGLEEEIKDSEVQTLRVAYLALLHQLGSIKQEVAALPPLHIVQSTLPGVHSLASWKYFLESKRFRFPQLVISPRNNNTDFESIRDYLSLCFEIKEEYETKVSEAVEKEKLRQTEKALQALHGEWITPVNKKMLWRWIRAHLPEKYQADAEGWLGTIFLGSNKTVLEFTKEDILLAEEIIVSSCPAGTGVMFAVRKRLDALLRVWEQENEAWEIDWSKHEERPQWVNAEKVPAKHPGEEPKAKDFASRAQFLQAHARWVIANKVYQQENS